MAHDAVGGRVLLFGGRDGSGTLRDDTWAFNNANWSQLSPTTAPAARAGAVMVHHPPTDEVLLFGGMCAGGACPPQTWVWSGINWATRGSPSVPSPRIGAMATYDPVEQVVIVQGGEDDQGGPLEDTWVWDGVRWFEATNTGDAPVPRLAGVMTTDGQSVVLFGGAASRVLDDTWRQVDSLDERAGHVFEPTLVPAQIGPGIRRRVSARWQAGADSGGATGAELVVWNGLGWSVVDAHNAPAASPSLLCAQWSDDTNLPADPDCAQIVDPAQLQTLFRTGDAQVEAFGVRPTRVAGTDGTTLRTTDLAVTVRYRLPAN